jgi:hypothetical protein
VAGNEGLQWISDLGGMAGIPMPRVDARVAGGSTVAATPASRSAMAKPTNAKVASKGTAPAAGTDAPLEIDVDKVGGRMVKRHIDPDDPDSPEVEEMEIPAPPPAMPTTLPNADITRGFLRQLHDHALIMVGAYGMSIYKACHAFEGYSNGKIDALAEDEHLDPSAFAGALLSGALTLVGANIAEKVVDEVGKRVVDALADAVKDGAVDATKEAGKPESDLQKRKDDLRNAVQKMTQKALDVQGAMHDKVRSVMDDFLRDLLAQLKKGKLDGNDAKKIYPYVESDDPHALDQVCEALGVPDAASSKEIDIKCYGELVTRFEAKLAGMEVSKYLEVSTSSKNQQEFSDEAFARAKKNALAARKARRADLDKSEAEVH